MKKVLVLAFTFASVVLMSCSSKSNLSEIDDNDSVVKDTSGIQNETLRNQSKVERNWVYKNDTDKMTNHISVEAILDDSTGNACISAWISKQGKLSMAIIMNETTDIVDYSYNGDSGSDVYYRARFGKSQCGTFKDSKSLSDDANGIMWLDAVSKKIKSSNSFIIEVPIFNEGTKVCYFRSKDLLNVSKLKK